MGKYDDEEVKQLREDTARINPWGIFPWLRY
jgi:hypothetical protein